MRMAIKRENDKFLVKTLKQVCGLTRPGNPARTQNCSQLLMKMSIKHENNMFLAITLKHVSGLTVVVNLLGTPKLWVIPHENGHKRRKQQVSSQISQTCIGPYGRYKSPWKSQTVGNS